MFFNCCLLFLVFEVERVSWEVLQSPDVSVTVTITQPLSCLMLVLQEQGISPQNPKGINLHFHSINWDFSHGLSDAGR